MNDSSQGERIAADPPPRKVNGCSSKELDLHDDLLLSARAERILRKAEITTVDELCTRSPSDLRKLRGFGAGCLREVESALARHGRALLGQPVELRVRIDPGVLSALTAIGCRLTSQDNRATDAPIFLVEEKHRVTGFDPAYADDSIVWIDTANDCVEAEPKEHARLEAEWEMTGDEHDGWRRTAYRDEWRFVTACFTESGCAEYIRANGHNHRGELRIYAAGSYRNEEWRAVRKLLVALAEVSQ